MRRRLAVSAPLLALLSVASATCGGGGSAAPSGPPPAGSLVSPTNFRVILQRVLFTNNEIQFSWSGSGSTYRVSAGAASGGSELLNVEVTGTSYTWMAPRTEAIFYVRVAATQGTATSTAAELPVFTVDMRNVIDALFFGLGPMSQNAAGRGNPPANIWADGTRLTVRVSTESGDTARANAQTFVDEYAAVIGGAITAGVEVTPDDMKSLTTPSQLPLLTVVIRVLSGWCGGAGIIACANIGPAPVGSNRSIVTMNGASGGISIAHELGHAYGMQHVIRNASARAELDFMMNPSLVNAQMTETEKSAIRAARDGGLRAGMTRSQAEDAGLVNRFPSLSPSAVAGFSGSVSRGPVRCTIEGDGSRLLKTR